MPTVDQIADELYSLPPQQFTPARDAQVQRARADGDAAAAKAIGGLRKPTVTAWLVNLLALRRKDLIAELFELGDSLRQAQREGAALRDLSARHRVVLDGLLVQVRALAIESGTARPSPAALSEIKDTLAAALVDDEVAARVRAGRVLKTVSYAGFGQPPDAPAATPSRSAVNPPATAEDRAAVSAARAELERAERALADAVAADEAAATNLSQITAAIADLRARLPGAQDEAREAARALKAAEREASAARHRMARIDEG